LCPLLATPKCSVISALMRLNEATKRAAAVVAKAKPLSHRKSMINEEKLDRDFSDVEVALEIDDDADGVTATDKITAAADPKTKAKPLHMKVPKSKERALIREFGLDVNALTEEEAEKRRSELKTLVKMGKTRGFLTQDAQRHGHRRVRTGARCRNPSGCRRRWHCGDR
jgi:hypothetical protein